MKGQKIFEFDAFLSFNSANEQIASELKELFAKSGINIFFTPGRRDPESNTAKLVTGLSKSRAMFLLISKDGLGKYQKKEYETFYDIYCKSGGDRPIYIIEADKYIADILSKDYQDLYDENITSLERYRFYGSSDYDKDHIESIIKNFSKKAEETKALDKESDLSATIVEVGKDDFIIKGGFIGLQEEINKLENNEKEGVRLAVFGHLPSYLRLKPLKEEVAKLLFCNQESPRTIQKYVILVNKRKEIFEKYIGNDKNFASDIFFKKDIEDYVEKGCAASLDDVEDPPIEIKERLEALLEYNEKSNYNLYLLSEKTVIPKFILKSNVGLVIDLRSATSFGTRTHFDDSISGLHIAAKDILDVFKYQFNLLKIDAQNRVSQNRKFLQEQIDKINSKMQ